MKKLKNNPIVDMISRLMFRFSDAKSMTSTTFKTLQVTDAKITTPMKDVVIKEASNEVIINTPRNENRARRSMQSFFVFLCDALKMLCDTGEHSPTPIDS